MEIANISVRLKDAQNQEGQTSSEKSDHYSRVESFLLEVNYCPLCGSHLNFNHDVSADGKQIQEVSICSFCNLNSKPKLFTLH
jgi:hypothetical protein